MFLITEQIFDGIQTKNVIDESTGKKNYYVEGIFLQAEEKNRNGRIYASSILEREVERFRVEYINKNRSVGELNHPESPSINYERSCQLIESLTKNGNNWEGRAKILSTPMGNIIKGLVDDGVQVGESSRGLGTLTEREGINYVNEDYYMTTIDVVSDPSAPAAFVNGIFEGKEFYMGNDTEFIEKVKKYVDKESSKVGFSMVEEQVVIIAFEKMLNNITEQKMQTYKEYIKEFTRLKGAIVGGLIAGPAAPAGAIIGAMAGKSNRDEAARQRKIRDAKIAKIKHNAKRKLERSDPSKKGKIRLKRDQAIERLMSTFKKKWDKHDY